MIFKIKFVFVNTLLFSFSFISVDSVPEDYCLRPLNTSDCGRPPTPVFYYYKPGSRCEIKIWRGCPTENLFSNEYHCSHHCIGKLWSSEQGAKVEANWKKPESKVLIGPTYRCDVPINLSQCKQAKQLVYTYDTEKKKCTEVTYYGCPTENKFRDRDECEDVCEKSKVHWEQDIKHLNLDELSILNNMLDEVNDEIIPEKEYLKKHVNDKKIRPNTVKDYDVVTDEPGDDTNKIDVESKESTEKPEESTESTEKSTDKPKETTSQPKESTSKPEETTSQSEESTTKLEELTSQTEVSASEPDEPTNELEESTSQTEVSVSEPEELTTKQKESTSKPEAPTDTPEATTEAEEIVTEADTTVASTNAVQVTTVAGVQSTELHHKRTRKRRATKTVQEGDVVREGNYDYKQ